MKDKVWQRGKGHEVEPRVSFKARLGRLGAGKDKGDGQIRALGMGPNFSNQLKGVLDQ